MTSFVRKSRASGFTIVELLIVIVVIGILATLVIISYNGVIGSARDKTVISDAESVAAEATRYATKHNGEYGTAINWYSGGSSNANIAFTPSGGNIVDISANTSDYCIRVFNSASSQYKTLDTAYKKGSSSTACDSIPATDEAIAAADTSAQATNLTWTARTGPGEHDWSTVASSSDGTKLIAAVSNGGYVYTSSDSGATWTARTSLGSHYWTSVASSSDGTKLIAVYGMGDAGSFVYRSTDSGATWNQLTNAGQRQSWSVVASSPDGTVLYAGACWSYMYRSTDSGATWTAMTSLGNRCWNAAGIAISSNGSKVAITGEGNLFTTTDGGANWTNRGSASYWISVASSSDGAKLVVAAYNGYLHTSSDGGSTLTPRTAAGQRAWIAVAMSQNGNRILAGVDDDEYSNPTAHVFTSLDNGATWQEQTTLGGGSWRALAMSSNGLKIVAGSYYSTYTNTSIQTGVYTTP